MPVGAWRYISRPFSKVFLDCSFTPIFPFLSYSNFLKLKFSNARDVHTCFRTTEISFMITHAVLLREYIPKTPDIPIYPPIAFYCLPKRRFNESTKHLLMTAPKWQTRAKRNCSCSLLLDIYLNFTLPATYLTLYSPLYFQNLN